MGIMVLIAGYREKTGNYQRALERAGMKCLVSLSLERAKGCDRLLLPGGGDLDPRWFHEKNQGARDIDRELDEKQFAVLDWFVGKGRPVLGICRGMQVINVYFGGNIIQDLSTAAGHQYKNADQFHGVVNRPGARMCALYGSACIVNSAHHQGCGKLGEGLVMTQAAGDGVVEAVEHASLPVLGVQWHPERMPKRTGLADGLLLIREALR